jgi:hypothetical protein
MLVEKTPDAAIKSAQEKILKMEKQQLELEAKKIAEDLKKEVDVEGVVKKDLKKKGKKVEEVKSGLRTAEERQAEIGKVFEKKGVKEVPKKKKKVKPSKPKVDTGESLAKEFELRYMGEIEGLEYYGMETLKGETTLATKGVDRKALIKRMDEVKRQFEEPEPITELDRQTGTSIPTLEGEKSPFFQTKEEADAMAKVYEGRKIVDVEVLTQKLINDVNRACHGDKSVDITKVRDELSEIATRADELNMAFDSPADFREWKATVEEAAIWARRSEPLRLIKKQREGVELYSGIDPTKILDVIKKIRRVTPEIISEYEVPSMLKYHPETAREVKAKIAKERRVAIKEPKTFEGFGPLDGKKIEFIHHIKHKYSKTLKQAKDISISIVRL